MSHHPGIARITASVAASLDMIDAPESQAAFIEKRFARYLLHCPEILAKSVFRGPEQVDSHLKHPLVFLIGCGRVFHLKEGGAWQVGAVTTVAISTLVHRAII